MNKRKPRILVVDNYDSFTYNLLQIISEYGKSDNEVIKCDQVNLSLSADFDGFLFSPGPGTPDRYTVMSQLLGLYCRDRSFLGICLGHQAIAGFLGMKLHKLETVRHGLREKVNIVRPADYLFEGIPASFQAGYYHSWYTGCSNDIHLTAGGIRVTALSDSGQIAGIAHDKFNIRGIQFHPESYMSEYGDKIIHNWIDNIL